MLEILKPGSEKWDVAWHGFEPGTWQSRVNVHEFIQRNYTPSEGNSAFLQGAGPMIGMRDRCPKGPSVEPSS